MVHVHPYQLYAVVIGLSYMQLYLNLLTNKDKLSAALQSFEYVFMKAMIKAINNYFEVVSNIIDTAPKEQVVQVRGKFCEPARKFSRQWI